VSVMYLDVKDVVCVCDVSGCEGGGVSLCVCDMSGCEGGGVFL
jgi:hypothetical protein